MTASTRHCPRCGEPTSDDYPTHARHVESCAGPAPFARLPNPIVGYLPRHGDADKPIHAYDLDYMSPQERQRVIYVAGK